MGEPLLVVAIGRTVGALDQIADILCLMRELGDSRVGAGIGRHEPPVQFEPLRDQLRQVRAVLGQHGPRERKVALLRVDLAAQRRDPLDFSRQCVRLGAQCRHDGLQQQLAADAIDRCLGNGSEPLRRMARETLDLTEQLRLLDAALVEAALPPGGVAAEQLDVVFQRSDRSLELLRGACRGDAFAAQGVEIARGVWRRAGGRVCRRRHCRHGGRNQQADSAGDMPKPAAIPPHASGP